MIPLALRMLFGDRTKYLTLVLGLAFASLLMNQQGAIFMGLLTRATGPLQNISQPDLWVADPDTPWIAEYRALSDQKLSRVRSVAGVEWAEPFFTGYAVCELRTQPPKFKRVQIIGIARGTLAGRPPQMLEGSLEDLRTPDAVIVDKPSLTKLGTPDKPVRVGDELKINDRRAVVVGIAKVKQGFESNAIMYTTFDNALRYSPVGREAISYVLVKVKPGFDVASVQSAIDALGDVQALTRDQFRRRSLRFVLVETGIGFNFGITIALGFFVGLALSASIFYQFTLENLKHFAVLKAMGARAWTLIGMVLTQALVVGLVGYGIGVGIAGLFTIMTRRAESQLETIMPWQLMVISFGATVLTIMLGSLLSIRRVLSVSPGRVFSQ